MKKRLKKKGMPKYQAAGISKTNPLSRYNYQSVLSQTDYDLPLIPTNQSTLPSAGNTPYVQESMVYNTTTGRYEPAPQNIPSAGNTPFRQADTSGTIPDYMAQGMGNTQMSQQRPPVQSMNEITPTGTTYGTAEQQLQQNVAEPIQDFQSYGQNRNTNYNNQGDYQFYNPYGGFGIPEASYLLGQGIESGNAFDIAVSGLKLATGLGRNIFSGIGQERRRNYVLGEAAENYRDSIVPAEQSMQMGGYVFDEGTRPMTDETVAQLRRESGIDFTDEFARAYFRQAPLETEQTAANTAQRRPAINPQSSRIADITSATNRYTPDGGVMVGDYKKVWMNQKPEYFTGRQAPVEGQDFMYMNDTEYKNFQTTPNYQNYKAGYPPNTVAMFQEGGVQEGSTIESFITDYLTSGEDPNLLPDLVSQYYNIPPEQAQQIIEQLLQPVMQKGGTFNKVLTGEYTAETGEEGQKIAELEHGEHIQKPDGNITEVIGEKHSNGGVELTSKQLPENSRIISDYLKVGADGAKSLGERLDLKLKAGDTYATVLDKYNRKSGLAKITEEQEALNKRLQKQLEKAQENPQSESTIAINTQFLQEELYELEQEKIPLEEERKSVFEEIFQHQEASKPKEEQSTVMQAGGTYNGDMITGYAKKYGISPERARELISFQAGGYFTPLPYNTGNFGRQSFTQGTNLSGQVNPENLQQRVQAQAQYLPYLTQRTDLASLGDVSRFQVGYDQYLDAGNTAIQSNPYMTAQDKESLVQQLQKERFGEGVAKDYDAIYGDFTSSRSGFSLPALTPKDKAKYGDKLKFVGDAFDEKGNIKPEFEELDPTTKNYLQTLQKEKGSNAYDIGLLDIPQAQPTASQQVLSDVQNTENPPMQQGETADAYRARTGLLLLPNQSPLLPEGLQGALKIERRYDRVDVPLANADAQIQEIRRTTSSAKDAAYANLPPQQAAAVASNLDLAEQEQINKVMTQTQGQNIASQAQANQANAQIQMAEENARAQDLEGYERKILTADAKTLANIRNYYNTLQKINTQNYNTVSSINFLNQSSENFDYTNNGIENTRGVLVPDYASVSASDYEQYKIDEGKRAENLRKQRLKKRRFGGKS